ncbi:N-acyl-D-amino-acid deacylase family protein [Pyramidobacter piscolens]|uniref:N-acyl-D-amino-acid deacylase family protein n=1 Tax=Pyramidobacter piscolens TaxID=638849 RepID=UPI00332FDF5A
MLDLLIRNGTVIDGTRTTRRKSDVGVRHGKIVAVAPQIEEEAKETIDASGKIVAPGFIDIHSHSDMSPFFTDQKMQSKLYQGITLEIVGNCGISCLPTDDASREAITRLISSGLELPMDGRTVEDDSLSDYAEHLKRCPAATNIGVLVGHGTLRGMVMGFGMRKPTFEEQKHMECVLERELSEGAFGMSLGLIYPPSSYGAIDEFVALGKVLKRHDAILTVHMRSESTKIFEAVDEMLEVARHSGVHVEISHLKLIGKPQWGRSKELLAKIRAAREEGLNITCDQYPYTATSTGMSALVPAWAHDGGSDEMCKRLASPTEELLSETESEIERRGGAHAVLVVSTHGRLPQYEGKRLDEIAANMELPPAQAVVRLLRASDGGVPCCYFSLSEDDMLHIMREQFVCIGSDGYAMTYDRHFLGTNPHPRSFGTFPRYFQTIREHRLMSLEDAVYKATMLPAQILGLKDRGVIAVDKIADITVFDAAEISDRATYTDSPQKPAGICAVVIDGRVAFKNGEQTGDNIGHLVVHK